MKRVNPPTSEEVLKAAALTAQALFKDMSKKDPNLVVGHLFLVAMDTRDPKGRAAAIRTFMNQGHTLKSAEEKVATRASSASAKGDAAMVVTVTSAERARGLLHAAGIMVIATDLQHWFEKKAGRDELRVLVISEDVHSTSLNGEDDRGVN